jgi:hypothetical protein
MKRGTRQRLQGLRFRTPPRPSARRP